VPLNENRLEQPDLGAREEAVKMTILDYLLLAGFGRPFFTQATDYSLAGCAPVHQKQWTKPERSSPQSNRSLLKPVSSRAHPGSHAINQIMNPATCAADKL
jgi:hypothetical protein